LQLELVEDEYGEQEPVVPEFQEEWEDEYQESSFQPREMILVFFISAAYFIAHFFAAVFSHGVDDAGGDINWIVLTWMPELVYGVSSTVFLCLLRSNSTRILLLPTFGTACALNITLAYAACILPQVLLELRRARFQSAVPGHVHWDLNYSTFPPARSCTDSDPLSTLYDEQRDTAGSGCNSLVLSGATYCACILWNLVPRICRTSAVHAASVAIATALILVFSALSVGAHGWPLAACVAFQLSVGLGAAHFCRVREATARAQFAVVKGTKFAAEQNRNLLFTLYPRNVVDRLAAHDGRTLLCKKIDMCSVMFCSLEPQDSLRAEASEGLFALLDDVFTAFDACVLRHRMFKYQVPPSRHPVRPHHPHPSPAPAPLNSHPHHHPPRQWRFCFADSDTDY
jgi:hypothetical protein